MKANHLRILLVVVFLCIFSGILRAEPDRYFPDLPPYRTLVCDLHMHTVFSDGQVWPTVRVDEAAREHLDAIALSDHIEYLPHKDDILKNFDRPYEIAAEPAKKKDILLIKGAEITRETPPGHYNALFLNDINPLETPEFLDAIRNANEQKAFVFWNHHAWKGAERGRWEQVQTTMYENHWLHGMEVANGDDIYPDAIRWCLEKNLTMMGNSDIHSPSYFYPYAAGHHRTVTLVFADDRSVDAIKGALFAGRTAAWVENQLIGRREYLEPLFNQCITVSTSQISEGAFIVKIGNAALIDMVLKREGGAGPQQITVPARSSASVFIKTDPDTPTPVLLYQVSNFLIAPDKGLPVKLPLLQTAPAAN